jgi:hypothetical protein
MAKKRWIISDLNIMMDLDYLNPSLKPWPIEGEMAVKLIRITI